MPQPILTTLLALLVCYTPLIQAQTEPAHDLNAAVTELKFGALTGDEEKARIEELHLLADEKLDLESEDCDSLIARARILAYHAHVLGGLEALGFVKEAKALLEKSISIDPTKLEGYAHVLLGVLYYRVPPWPLGYRNHKHALSNLKRAIEIDPSGYESNYNYGEYLLKRKKHEEAKKHLEEAASSLTATTFAAPEKRRRIKEILTQINL
jgi:tetratricopeptide (TPR) repeat protein